MSRIAGGDLAALTRGLTSWLEQWEPAAKEGARIESIERPASGWSGDTLIVTVRPAIDLGEEAASSHFVARIAPSSGFASFPVTDLEAQAAVMNALRRYGAPAPRVMHVERDLRWVGSQFLVMGRVPGRSVGDTPALDGWLMALPKTNQRLIHESYIDTLATIHRLDWHDAGLVGLLRDAGEDLTPETAWWTGYIDWAADGEPTPSLVSCMRWCTDTAPVTSHARSLCWGDARLGNVMLLDDGSASGLLDWELASIGPPEMDLAWYLALDRLTARIAGITVPGFLTREEVIARYEHRLGRRTEHLEWHEIFALVRSVAINDRQARMAAATGVEYPGFSGEDNPLLAYIGRRILRFEGKA